MPRRLREHVPHQASSREATSALSGAVVKSKQTISRLTRLTTGVDAITELFPTIRLNQLQGLQKLKEFLELGETKGYFRMPTGAGKTILFGLIAKILAEPTLILVPNTNLLHSTQDELVSLGIAETDIGIVGDGFNEEGRQMTIMTYQSFLSRGAPKGTSLFVCDEVHRSLGERTRERIDQVLEDERDTALGLEAQAEEEALARLMKEESLVLGFTATPVLGRKTVEELHGKLIAETFYADLVSAGILKWVEVHQVEGEVDSETEAGTMTKEKEDKLVKAAGIYEKVLLDYGNFKETHKDYPLRAAAFCHSVDACEIFQAKATAVGFKSKVVTGRGGDLEEAERELLAGEIDFIITVDKLKEGWNFPPVNTILWLRGTSSPASLIQGVGRGMRAYLEEGTTHLFETNWRVSAPFAGPEEGGPRKGKSATSERSSRPSTKALTFAQALAHLGENVAQIIRNSEDVDYFEFVVIDDGGLGQINRDDTEVGVLGLSSYCSSKDLGFTTLELWLEEAGVKPIKGCLGIRGSRNFPVYMQAEVEAVLEARRPKGKTVKLVEGVGKLIFGEPPEEIEVVGLTSYAGAKDLYYQTLVDWVTHAGLEPLPEIVGLKYPVAIFNKAQVDAIIASNTVQGDTVDLDKNGIGVFEKADAQTSLVGINSYAAFLRIPKQTLKKWLLAAGIVPLSGVTGKKGPATVDVYSKLEVDRVVQIKRPDTKKVTIDAEGKATIETEAGPLTVVGLNSYADFHRMNSARLVDWIEEAGVQPVPGFQGLNVHRTFPLYLKDLVDDVLSARRRQ